MGLEQYFYKIKKEEAFDRYNKNPYGCHFPLPDEEYYYFRKNRLIHNYVYNIYCKLSEQNNDMPVGRERFNTLQVKVTLDDLDHMFYDFTRENVDDRGAFVFGDVEKENLISEALRFICKAIEDLKNAPEYCLVYDSWW